MFCGVTFTGISISRREVRRAITEATKRDA